MRKTIEGFACMRDVDNFESNEDSTNVEIELCPKRNKKCHYSPCLKVSLTLETIEGK